MKTVRIIITVLLSLTFVSSTPLMDNTAHIENEAVFESSLAADPMLGEIIMFAGSFAPRGWAFCDGSLLPISENSALFSILGTIYGGDGRSTFALPNLENQGNVKYIIAIQGFYPSRN